MNFSRNNIRHSPRPFINNLKQPIATQSLTTKISRQISVRKSIHKRTHNGFNFSSAEERERERERKRKKNRTPTISCRFLDIIPSYVRKANGVHPVEYTRGTIVLALPRQAPIVR